MRFYLSNTKTNLAGFNQLASLAESTKDLFADRLELDLSACNWLDANMAAPLGAVLATISDALNDVSVVNVPEKIRTILRKNEFLKHFGDSQIPDSYGTAMPYRRVDLNDERYFAAYLGKYTQNKGIPKMTSALQRRFFESIGELYANAMMHSQSKLGVFVCGQYFPKKHCFDFCISDAGDGFEGSILRAFDIEVDSIRAMKFCLTEGNTTKKHEPGGLGLKLLQRFIELNQGRIVIVSKGAYYEYSNGKDAFLRLDSPFPGTCINIEINTADTTSYQLSNESSST